MDRDTLISLAAYGVICAGLGLAMTMALRIWQHRPRKPYVPFSAGQEHDLYTTILALERVITALEQDEIVEWKTQYSVLEDAELIAEQYLRQLEASEE